MEEKIIERSDKVDNDYYAQRDTAYIKEYESVIWQLQSIKSSIESVYKILDVHLSNDAKNFSIEYKGEKYEFFFPTTKYEFKKLKKQRQKFIKNILCDVITGSIRRPKRSHELHTFLALMLLGEDPKNHQFEQVDGTNVELLSEEEAGIGTNESGRKGIPLDMDAYQVKSNLIKLPEGMIELTPEQEEELKKKEIKVTGNAPAIVRNEFNYTPIESLRKRYRYQEEDNDTKN